jgi:stearoyl-CoA desaturase (delta-9 desaturase)
MAMTVKAKGALPLWRVTLNWFDNDALTARSAANGHKPGREIDWTRVLPFLGLHLGCFAVFLVGASTTAITVAVALYLIRMFAVTGFYHRFFSHRTFRTSRAMQFVFALLGATAVQRGPLWWASQHRHHHAHADKPSDMHSAHQHGFLWSHIGWFLARENFATRSSRIPDLNRFPELRFLDRFDALIPVILGVALYGSGELMAHLHPALDVSGWQFVVWGLCISTVTLYHATFTINSLAHRFGSRRYATHDDSRNNLWLALLTLGEGWHNNHHHYPRAARQGFYWWELDVTYQILRLLAVFGLIWDLKPVPTGMREARLEKRGARL